MVADYQEARWRRETQFGGYAARDLLGFEPRVDLATGLQLTMDWWKQSRFASLPLLMQTGLTNLSRPHLLSSNPANSPRAVGQRLDRYTAAIRLLGHIKGSFAPIPSAQAMLFDVRDFSGRVVRWGCRHSRQRKIERATRERRHKTECCARAPVRQPCKFRSCLQHRRLQQFDRHQRPRHLLDRFSSRVRLLSVISVTGILSLANSQRRASSPAETGVFSAITADTFSGIDGAADDAECRAVVAGSCQGTRVAMREHGVAVSQ